ncbi:TPA: DUF2829 domain-containing protein [Enterobacter cloacae]|nr:DUF2829 domain-containing protein [Enterobacter cloacae]HAS1072070.1 DUF2829 domain-containing protein [Enterobacter cloacae]HAS1125192.1 DUF2829 domain-containing protein [Enterobacter cloacae]
MNRHIGVKFINATPMTRGEYIIFRGWKLPADENGADEGYLVEYLDGGKPNTEQFSGYVSWSPKDVFELAYRPTTGLNFGHAIEALKNGACIARAGWNGKGMYLWLNRGAHAGIPPESHIQGVSAALLDANEGDIVTRLPNINMRSADGSTVTGWLASQTDILAEDWQIV